MRVCVCVEIKRLTHEKMKETQEFLSNKEQPDSEKYKALLEKGQVNVETYKKMIIMAQNVLRVSYTHTKITEQLISKINI